MTISKDYLDNLISNSLYPNELEQILNIEKNGKGIKDYGTFLGLSAPCSISLELVNSDETLSPNMDAESLKLSNKEKQRIFDILSSHNFDITMSEASPAKIYLSDTGLKFPYLKSDEALAMLSDVVDELKANDINTYGYAHPKVKSSFVKCVEDTGYDRDNIDTSLHADKNILGNKSFEDFVSNQLKNAEKSIISEEEIDKYTKINYGKSIYRGGTTGDNPYAVLSKSCTKDFLYGSNDFATAKRYSGELRGYKPVDGKRYGFIYEYEAAPNQKYYNDYEIENGIKGFGIDRASLWNETPIYEHRNKLKGIYLNVDGKICRIADEKGYLSKNWEDFAKLHTLEFMVKDSVTRTRENAIKELADKNEIATTYIKRTYNIQQISPKDYISQYTSRNQEYLPKLLLTGTIDTNILDKFPNNVILRNANLVNIDDCNATLSGNINFKDNVNLTKLNLKDAHLKSDIPLDVKNINASGDISLDNIKFLNNLNIEGKHCTIKDSYLPDNTNLENIKNLTMSGSIHLSEGCKFPDKVTFNNANIGGNVDLKNTNMILEGHVIFGNNVKLPEKLPYYNNVKSITLSEKSFNQTKIPENYFIVITDDNNTPKSILYNQNAPQHIQLAEKYKELTSFNSVETYRKCKETEKILTSWGVDKDSYMMFTKNDNIHTTYNNTAKSIKSYFEDGAKEIANTKSNIVYGSNNGIVSAYFDNDVYIISQSDKLRDILYRKGKDVGLGVMMSNGEQFCNQYGDLDRDKNNKWRQVSKIKVTKDTHENTTNIKKENITHQQSPVQSVTENKASDLQETLKNQAETAHQNKVADAETKAATETKVADKDLHSTLKAQKEKSSLGNKFSSVSDGIDKAFEKGGAALNDNAVGRAINKADSWRPKNKFATKVMDKAGAVPVAAVVATGVSAYEQYKSGDKKGAAATFGKGVAHATVQGVATSAGMNVAAKGVSKAAEKVTEKVVTHQTAKQAAKTAANAAAKAASKQVAKAAGKAAGKAVGKSVLKKIPLVSLGAGAYFAFERAKNGEWGKAGCELLSGALGCFPGVGTAASTAVDCGLAVADTKKAIDDTKKQQAKQTQKQQTPQKPKQQTKQKVTTQRVEELRNSKGSQSQQKTATKNKQVEKSFLNRLKDSLWSR